MTVRHVAVLGSGQMGSGIAQVFAQSGYEVTLYDLQKEALNQSKKQIERLLLRSIEKERITSAEKEATMKRLQFTRELSDLKHVNLVVEAVVEDEAVKVELFKQLDDMTSEDTILASNTSSIPITKLAAATQRPDRKSTRLNSSHVAISYAVFC